MSGVRSHLRTRLLSPAVLLPCAPARQPWSGAIRGCMSDTATQPHAAGTWAEVQRLPTGHGFCIHPAAGDACLHLAALPGANRSMGATRRVAPLCIAHRGAHPTDMELALRGYFSGTLKWSVLPADSHNQGKAA